MNRVQSLLGGLIIVVLIIGAVLAGLFNFDPARAWSQVDSPTGAPAATTGSGAELVDARRATGEALSQAGFLTSGTSQLVDGTSQLGDGAGELVDGVGQAADGSKELASAMRQLQAGVGQLGAGATELANGVESAVAPVIGLGAMRGQVLTAMDSAISDLKEVDDPDAKTALEDLRHLREQAANIPIEDGMFTDLERMRSGARELANQLAVPGYGFHDGIYLATEGSQRLADGLSELQGGAQEAAGAISQLQEGAEQIDVLATNTSTRINAISRALPGPTPGEPGVEGETGATSAISPYIALLVASLVMLIGLVAGLASAPFERRRWLVFWLGVVGAGLTGLVALLVLGSGVSINAALAGAGVLTLAAAVGAGLGRVLLGVCGPVSGTIAAAGLGIAQLGLVGWVWQSAATSDAPTWAQILAGVMPLHWATTAVTAFGNVALSSMSWTAVAIVSVLAVIGGVSVAFSPAYADDAKRVLKE